MLPVADGKKVVVPLLALSVASMFSSYFREIFFAAKFGTGFLADAYLSAFTIIRFVTDIVPCAVLLACVVPVVAGLLDRPLTVRRHLLSVLSLLTLAATGGLALLLDLAMPWLLTVAAPGFAETTRHTAITLADAMVWFLPLHSISFLFSLALNAHGRFRTAAAAPILSNGLFILVLALSGEQPGLGNLAFATLAGPGLTILLLGSNLARMGLLGFGASAEAEQALRSMWKIARPMLLTLGLGSSTGLLMICHLALRRQGSMAGEGSVAALAYAFRIYEVPVSLTANIAGTLLLPSLSALHGVASPQRLGDICRRLIEWGLLLLVPVVFVTMVDARLLVDIVLVRGRFSADAAVQTAEALRGFAPAILFEAGIVVFYRVLYAMRRPKTTLVTSLAVFCFLILTLMLIPPQQVGTLAQALSASFALGMLILAAVLYRQFGATVLPLLRPCLASAGAVAFGGAAWFALSVYPALGLLGFCVTYLTAGLLLLPSHRATLLGVLRHRGQT